MNITNLEDELRKEYRYRIEMHAHTKPASLCSEVLPNQLVEIYAKLGFDAVVLTNHFIFEMSPFDSKNSIKDGMDLYLKGYYDAKKYAEKYGIKILLGSEIRFTENHNDYLIYGVDEKMLYDIYPLLSGGIENFRKEYKMPNSVLVQAHPFRDNMTTINSKLLDGIETYNMHPGHNSRVAMATRYAKDNAIDIVTAGTDFHHLNVGHEGAAALRTKILPNDSFELAKILKSKDYIFEIGDNSIVLP